MQFTRDQRKKNRRESRGFIWYGLQKLASPLNRYHSIISERAYVIREFGGLHGNSHYFMSTNEKKYVRLQVVEATVSYIKIDARLVLKKSAEKNAESIGFNALFGENSDSIKGVCATVEEIDSFLDDICEKWVWRHDPNAGSKWSKVPNGYRRNSDGRIFQENLFHNDGGGWYTILGASEYICFHENDLINK
jgi:hypothetical protein